LRTGAEKLSAGRGEPQRSARCPARLIAGKTTSPAGPHRAGDGAGRAVRGAGRRLGNGSECHAEPRRVRCVSRPEDWRPGDGGAFLQRTSTPEQRPNKFGPTAPVGPIHSATRPASNSPGKAPADVSLFEWLGQAFGVVMSLPSHVKVGRHSPHSQASGGCCFLPGEALPESPQPSAVREQGLGAPSLLRKTRRANQAPLTFDQLRIHGGVGGSSLGSSVALRRASLRACSARVALISRITASRSAASSGSANSPVSSVSGVSLPSSYSAHISLA